MSNRFRLQNFSHFIENIVVIVRLVWQTYPGSFVSYAFIIVFEGCMPLATAWIVKLLFDSLAQSLTEGRDIQWSYLIKLLVIQVILTLASQAIPLVQNYWNGELSRRLERKIASLIYGKANSFVGIAYFENPELHDTLRLAEQGAQQNTMGMLGGIRHLGQSIVTLISFLGVLFAFNPLLLGLVLLAALPKLYMQFKFGTQHFNMALQLSPQQREKYYYGYLISNSEAAKEIRLFNLGNFFLNRILKLYETIQKSERHQELYELRWNLLLQILSSLIASCIFILVVVQAFMGRLSLGDVTLYISTAEIVGAALTEIIFSISGLNQNALFYTYFEKLMALPQPLPLAKHPRPIQKLEKAIELRHLSFRYSERHPWVLQDVNFKIPAGQCLALVGLNGAGKTTIVKLLARLYDPVEGQILWDGVDIREFDPVELRGQLGAIFQDFMHYDLTAQENIGLGDVQHVENLERVQQAATKAGIHERMEQLPQGYQTQISLMFGSREQDGVNLDLSGGEWQKIALARMFMRNANFLILDEPTAALDARAECDVYNHFLELVSGKTSLLISHRFSTVRMADWIAVLEEGKIIEQGSHDQLIAKGGKYAELYNMQARRYQ
jgi:ATP-binding cassette subfamily B protein